MRVLHVNNVASVGSMLVRASGGRDALYQPYVRRDFGAGRHGSLLLAGGRAVDAVRIARTFARGGFTHLHVHYATFATLAELAGLPYSLHVHGADVLLDPGAGGVKGALAIRGVERAARVVVSTPDLVEPARRLRSDAAWIPNPMELPPRRDPAGGARASGSRPRAIVLSKMDYLKGWDRQVATIEALVHALPGVELRFFTHGQLPAAVRARLAAKLVSLGAEESPPMPRATFVASLAAYHFAIGQMEVGALGMSELEAMASALPTVADASAHAAAGAPAPAIAPELAADELARLWADENARRDAGLAAREYVERVHDPARALEALERALLG